MLAALAELAGRNRVARSMIGLGYHDTITPPVIQRNILENPGWYTAYTPYQPEISQGRLEALLNFQTMVMDLSGLSCTNASLLDEATAAAEAMHMSHGIAKNGSDRFFVSDACLPQTIAVVQTRADAIGIEVEVGDHRAGLPEGPFFGVLLQYPETGGGVPDYRGIVEQAHAQGAIVTVAADLLSLVLLTPPGEFGADIAVGSSQRFGVPLGYGGPHAAYFATHEKYRRAMPGRIVGVSVDSRGRQALRLALQTREQHIRREKATSNICTAQVLLGVIAGMYAVYHGPEGLTRIAQRTHRLTDILAAGLERLGFAIENESWFDTLTVRAPGAAEAILNRAEAAGHNLRPIDGDRLGIACDETTARADIEAVWRAFAGEADPQFDVAALDGEARCGLPKNLARQTPFLEHPVFNLYHAETELLRYMRRLEGRDLTLNQAMIPLGSCTMKLNATAEMMPITWPGFGAIHPFAPAAQAAGYRELVTGLERMLSDITGFAAVSLQPNAGSQGEYAGLLVIRRYHESRGEGGRQVCLIPSSAHGTNPASAVMAGMTVQVVACDDDGNVDLADLRAKAEAHSARPGGIDDHLSLDPRRVRGIHCRDLRGDPPQRRPGLHGRRQSQRAARAQPARAIRPGRGASQPAQDLLHPPRRRGAGGGPHRRGGASRALPAGPSTGPGIRPGGRNRPGFGGALGLGRDSADLLGLYRDDGPLGLTRASEVAILSANYIAKRLAAHYPVLYTAANGLVAHECIIEMRHLKRSAGIEVDDVAKRLMDYGFHAPTMSFPVAGTLMIEPTESESKAELDRFCDAMIAIRAEIAAIEEGRADPADNPLKNAPHTMDDIADTEWERGYSRAEAVFPSDGLRQAKYWPPVNRIDQVHGDRNLICACPPLESYQEAAE